MSVKKYLNRNKLGGLILIIVIIIAFGFGGFGGGFLSNNQNNIAKINKKNITTQDLINFINQSGIDKKTIQDNLDNNIISELLSNLISTTLLDLEIQDFDLKFSKNSLSKKIKFNENFLDDNGNFQRVKYEKFLLENNISAPIFETRLKERELQKKLFDFIGAGTVSPQFLVKKLFENENRKLEIEFINLESFYKKENEFNNQDLIEFIQQNSDQLKIEYIDFSYSIINPQILIGINEFNQEFFDKVDEIENDILNDTNFSEIIKKFDLNSRNVENYRFSNENDSIEQKIFDLRKNKFDIFENGDDFIIYKITNSEKKEPDLKDQKTKKEILELVIQKNRFEYNKKLIDQINENKFNENNFLQYGEENIQSFTLNSVRDNKKFEINSVEILYTMPIGAFTLINDEEGNIFLTKVKKYIDIELNNNDDNYKSIINKENSLMRSSILKSYDFFLNDKYNIDVNQTAIDSVKNLFQ
tara:strand:- start:333 stop:1751 length:1419 start_codon:yes stop_codon:yes gene_type:complete